MLYQMTLSSSIKKYNNNVITQTLIVCKQFLAKNTNYEAKNSRNGEHAILVFGSDLLLGQNKKKHIKPTFVLHIS